MESRKRYGGKAFFSGYVLLVCSGIIAYNIHMMNVFKELDYTYPHLDSGANIINKLTDKYFSIFESVLGRYPSTKVLSIVIPVTLIVFICFIDYLIKFFKQKHQEKIDIIFTQEENTNDESAI